MLRMEIGRSHCGGHHAGSLAMKMRMKLDYSLTPNTKINCKKFEGLNKWTDSMELLGKKSRTHSDVKCSKIFFDPRLRIRIYKTKINKWDLTEVKSICTTKETISERKKDNQEWKQFV